MLTVDEIALYWGLGMSIGALGWFCGYLYAVAKRALKVTVSDE